MQPRRFEVTKVVHVMTTDVIQSRDDISLSSDESTIGDLNTQDKARHVPNLQRHGSLGFVARVEGGKQIDVKPHYSV